MKVPYNGLDNDNYAGGTSFCNSCRPGAKTNARLGNNENAELLQYYYHPDHLGSSSFITDIDGNVAQHVEYVPFGEVFLEEHNNTWQTPYLFNGKELDEETGLYYYGARYYESKISQWLSVDAPLLNGYYLDGNHDGGVYNSFNLGSYLYCRSNPIVYSDPDGNQTNKTKPKIVNVYISEDIWPNVYKTHLEGIKKGNPTVLTYDSNKTAARQRRSEAKAASGLTGSPEVNVDEYPYASTKEGGGNAAARLVPASENKSHGGYLGALVTKNKMETGDKFNIVLIPKKRPEPEPKPVFVPEYKKVPAMNPIKLDSQKAKIGVGAAIGAGIVYVIAEYWWVPLLAL